MLTITARSPSAPQRRLPARVLAVGLGVGGNGPPRLATNWIADRALNPYRIAEGRPPEAIDEVVVNRGSALAGGLHLGDVTSVQMPARVRGRIVGIATFGTADGLGQAT